MLKAFSTHINESNNETSSANYKLMLFWKADL